jgi:nucleotide-binding universal stress UspA family protein
MACALARDYRARLLLVHVETPMPVFSELGAVPPEPLDMGALERQLAQIKPTDASVAVTRSLLVGDEASEIVRFAEDKHADLIVMGTHGRTGFGRLLMGSVAETVLRQAPCPVLTIKTPMKVQTLAPALCETNV